MKLWSMFVWLSCAAATQSAAAQSSTASTVARVRAMTAATTLVCLREVERCIIPLYVADVGMTKCIVYSTVGTIEVKKDPIVIGASYPEVKVIWVLHKAQSSVQLGEYEFDTTDGIVPLSGYEKEADKQFKVRLREPNGLEARHWRFRWESTHDITRNDVKYQPKVKRIVGTSTEECEWHDPVIKNTS